MGSGLSRRQFIKGAGASLALPFLPSLLPRSAWGAPTGPLRMIYYFTPNGINMNTWAPVGTGSDFVLGQSMASLAPFKDELLLISGLGNHAASPQGTGGHGAGTAGCLTAHSVVKTEGTGISNGVSVDQLAAQKLAPDTLFKSMQLGSEGGGNVGNCDSGYSCAYVRNISWATPTTPLQKQVDPQVVFDRMYAGDDPTASRAEQEKRRRYRKSVLDYVLADANALKQKLGRSDKLKLDEYITGVRELEVRITRPPQAACGPSALPDYEENYPGRVRILTDLMVTAIECDMTRIITFMLGNGITNRAYRFLDVTGGHHELSHHQNDPGKLDKLTKIDTWQMEQFAYLLGRLKALQAGEGSLLDRCMVMLTGEMSDGNAHSQDNVPAVLAGKCGGAFTTGRHLQFEGGETTGDLFMPILGAFGVRVDHFGEGGTQALEGLKV